MKRILLISLVLALVGGAGAGYYFFWAGGAPAVAGADPATPGDPATADGALPAADQPSDPDDSEEGDDDEADPAVPIRVVGASVASISTYISSTANLVPDDEVKVLAEAEGRVTRLLVEEGDRVKKGQLLAALLRDEAEIAHNKATLKAANTRMAYDRANRMAGEDLISREDFDKTTMDHRLAEQELAEAKWRLDKTEIRAPFSGRLTKRSVTLGQHIRPGDELFVVTDFDPLIARIFLPERDVLPLKVGREAKITLKADESMSFRGRIRQISPVVDTATGTVKVTVAAIEPPAAVRPGGFVRIDIIRETHAEALVLPREAVIRELKTAHVFVAEDEVAHKRTVEVGLEEDGRLEILTGIAAGERVVIAGQGGLKDGSKVKILEDKRSDARAATLEDGRRRVG